MSPKGQTAGNGGAQSRGSPRRARTSAGNAGLPKGRRRFRAQARNLHRSGVSGPAAGVSTRPGSGLCSGGFPPRPLHEVLAGFARILVKRASMAVDEPWAGHGAKSQACTVPGQGDVALDFTWRGPRGKGGEPNPGRRRSMMWQAVLAARRSGSTRSPRAPRATT